MKNIKYRILLFTIINSNILFSKQINEKKYITMEELQEILKNYQRKPNIQNKHELLRKHLFNNVLSNAKVSDILTKIKYLLKIKKYRDIKYRCEYIEKYMLKQLRNKDIPFYYYTYAISLKNLKEYDKSIKYFNKVLNIEEKNINNLDILQELREVYKSTNNMDKVSEINNIIN